MVEGFECLAKAFILYFLCNGETLKIFEQEGETSACFTSLPAMLG